MPRRIKILEIQKLYFTLYQPIYYNAPPFFLTSYLFYLASAGIAEVLICKASSDWLKFCLLLSFWYLKL